MTQDGTSFRIRNAQSICSNDLPNYYNPLAGFLVAKHKGTIRHTAIFTRLMNRPLSLREGTVSTNYNVY